MREPVISIEGVKLFRRTLIHTDGRGVFYELFKDDVIGNHWIQENVVFSRVGVFRGMHTQREPYSQSKLIHCLSGTIYDIFLDLRIDSPTFGKFEKVYLAGMPSHDRGYVDILNIPPGVAHGYYCTNDSTVLYRVDKPYHPESEVVIKWDSFGYDWGPIKPKLSKRDANAITLMEYKTETHNYGNNRRCIR